MTIVAFLVAEVALGIVVGFLLSDNKKGLSMEEFKISNTIFLLSTIIIFWRNPGIDGMVFVQIATAWFLLMIGVLVGETIKTRMIGRILRTIRKKDIQLEVNELVNIAIRGRLNPSSDVSELLYKRLRTIQDLLKGLLQKDKQNEKLLYLYELCEDYVTLSVKIQGDICKANACHELVQAWEQVGNELTGLSWDTLNHTEENVKKELNKAFSVSLIKRSFHEQSQS